MLFTKSRRISARNLARRCYIECDGNVEAAKALAESRKDEVCSVVVWVVIGAAVIQAIYYAIKLWKELRLKTPPIEPLPREGFELAKGERFELTPSELDEIAKGVARG